MQGVFRYVGMQVCMHACIYTCKHVCLCVFSVCRMLIRTPSCVDIHKHTHIYVAGWAVGSHATRRALSCGFFSTSFEQSRSER